MNSLNNLNGTSNPKSIEEKKQCDISDLPTELIRLILSNFSLFERHSNNTSTISKQFHHVMKQERELLNLCLAKAYIKCDQQITAIFQHKFCPSFYFYIIDFDYEFNNHKLVNLSTTIHTSQDMMGALNLTPTQLLVSKNSAFHEKLNPELRVIALKVFSKIEFCIFVSNLITRIYWYRPELMITWHPQR